MIKLIIFDYDGVIADSFPLRFEIFQRLCPLLGKECPPTIDGLKRVWGDHAGETLANLGCSPEEVTRGKEFFKLELDRASPPLFSGIVDILRTLAKRYTLILLTANKESRIKEQLERNDAATYFAKIVGKETLFAAEFDVKKEAQVVALLEEFGVRPHEALFIADRDIDRTSALLAGIPDDHILLTDYGYGHTKKQPMRIDTPEHLLSAIAAVEK